MGCNRAYYLNPDDHPLRSIINIATGKIASVEVNVDEALQTGKDQMRNSKPGGLKHSTAKFPEKCKHVHHAERSSKKLIIETPVIDYEAIYAQVIGLLISNRSLDFNVILASPLSAYPPTMFDPTGHMRLAKSKSTRKKSLQGEIPTRSIQSNVTVIDDSFALWTIDWPANDTVRSFIDRLKYYVCGSKTEKSWYSPNTRLQPGQTEVLAQGYINWTETFHSHRVMLSCQWQKKQDATEQAHFWRHLGDTSSTDITREDPTQTNISERQI